VEEPVVREAPREAAEVLAGVDRDSRDRAAGLDLEVAAGAEAAAAVDLAVP